MAGSSPVLEGAWRTLVNVAANSTGSIHEGETAKALGYQGGLVTGTIVATTTMAGILDTYGPAWFEGGWYRFKFLKAITDTDEVRPVVERPLPERSIDLSVLKRDATLCTVGAAGLGSAPGVGGPWDPATDGERSPGDQLLHFEVGTTYDSLEFTPTLEQAERLAGAARDASSWYREASPWGGPVLPPEHLMLEALEVVRPYFPVTEVQGPSIWTEHALISRRPVMLGEPYRMEQRLADKGASGRTLFLVYEFEVTDWRGTSVALGRHKLNWFAANPEAE